jgi:hypothetical protein
MFASVQAFGGSSSTISTVVGAIVVIAWWCTCEVCLFARPCGPLQSDPASLPPAACCRVLGELPLLAGINLSTSTPLAKVPIPTIPRDLYPSLHSLAPLSKAGCSVWLDFAAQNLTPLHVLARWTNIPHPIGIELYELESASSECLALKGWSVNWVVSVLASLGSQDEGQPSLLLVDDADVDLLLAALGDGAGAIQSMGPLRLGGSITQAALGRLFRCEHLPGNTLRVGSPPEEVMPYIVGWDGGLELSSGHFTQLLEAGPLQRLHDLTVVTCCKLDNEGVAAVASAAGELRNLALQGTMSKVGDSALAAVAVGCRRIERLLLCDGGRVTVGGLRLLLTLAGGLNRVDLVCGTGAAEKLHREIEAMQARPAPAVFDAWQVGVTDGLLSISRKLGVGAG